MYDHLSLESSDFYVFIGWYIYLLLKVAVASNTTNMSQILCGKLKRYENSLFSTERKLCKADNHTQFLLTYKNLKNIQKAWNYDSICLCVTMIRNWKVSATKSLIKHLLVYGMKSLNSLTKKLEPSKQDIIKVVQTLKIKLQKKTID